MIILAYILSWLKNVEVYNMYFPYLRGRQFELLALRELAERDLISKYIVPIIEPVKMTSTLQKTLTVFNKKGLNLIFIKNPSVGYYISEINSDKAKQLPLYKALQAEIDNANILKALLFNERIKEFRDDLSDVSAAIVPKVDSADDYLGLLKDKPIIYTVIDDKRGLRRMAKGSKIALEDCFIRKERNIDYKDNVDEFFSDWHTSYLEEGYEGFSDFSIVGEKYTESGFAPIAVAIHIVYLDKKKNLRIHHFVSDSNEGIKDTAGKFGEAVHELKTWCRKNNVSETRGLKSLYECADIGKFPGLGVVKKYSIMHHLELMSNLLGD